jgi:hypothetical protein
MAKQNINIGVNPNDGTGDVVREAFRKSKENFDELYARPTGDMNKSTYDSNNSGAVDQADKITGVDAAGNVTYYGKDAAGTIGFHTFSPDKVDSYTDFASFPAAGFEGVVYIDLENLALYLWDDVNEVYVKPNTQVSESKTGTVLSLDKYVVDTYNYTTPSNATTYTITGTKVVNGAVSCFINAPSEPTVTGSTRVSGSGFQPNTNMEMVVRTPNGVAVEHYFLTR